jgi:hypothetical protein
MKYKERVVVHGMKLEALENKVEELESTAESARKAIDVNFAHYGKEWTHFNDRLRYLEKEVCEIKRLLLFNSNRSNDQNSQS